MGKSNTATTTQQDANNPTVLIKYSTEKQLASMGADARQITTQLAAIKVTNQATLDKSIEATDASQSVLDRIEEFRVTLVEKVRTAGERFTEVDDFFAGLKLGVTMSLPARVTLEKELKRVKDERAVYLDKQEQARVQAQNKLDAEQREKNKKIADQAAASAKQAGADPATVKEIKREILQAPAPMVFSKGIDTAREAGVGLQYDYSAEIYDVKKFLTLCLNNDMMLNTLTKALPDMEGAFRTMATDQKEKFVYEGIRFKKKPKDVQRRKG